MFGSNTPADPCFRLRGHFRNSVRDEKRASLDGANGTAVHLHPSMFAGGIGRQGADGVPEGNPRESRLRRYTLKIFKPALI